MNSCSALDFIVNLITIERNSIVNSSSARNPKVDSSSSKVEKTKLG